MYVPFVFIEALNCLSGSLDKIVISVIEPLALA